MVQTKEIAMIKKYILNPIWMLGLVCLRTNFFSQIFQFTRFLIDLVLSDLYEVFITQFMQHFKQWKYERRDSRSSVSWYKIVFYRLPYFWDWDVIDIPIWWMVQILLTFEIVRTFFGTPCRRAVQCSWLAMCSYLWIRYTFSSIYFSIYISIKVKYSHL